MLKFVSEQRFSGQNVTIHFIHFLWANNHSYSLLFLIVLLIMNSSHHLYNYVTGNKVFAWLGSY